MISAVFSYLVALLRTRFNPTPRVLKYRRQHYGFGKTDSNPDIDPDITDQSYDPDVKVNSYKQKQKRLSDSEISQIVERYSEGASTYELAAAFGCHRSTISRALKESGIEVTHEAAKREALTEQVLQMYADYCKPVDIGKELGINAATVRKILHENGAHIRSSSEYKGHTR